ncbi:hypothetical protein [Methanomethylophilus alvi]|uniref:hypothetical protein n=1 Tax=Methanomethylophilus alvi TaxID=1291540 RepID=UPI0037DD3585
MENETTMKIADWIKMNSNVSKIANDFGVSRPTMYKYIENYDAGQKDALPENVRTFFDEKLSEEDGTTIERIKDELKEQIATLEKEYSCFAAKIKNQMARYEEFKLAKDTAGDLTKEEAIERDMKQKMMEVEIQHSSAMLDHLQSRLDEFQRRLAQYEAVKVPILETKSVFKIKSRCYFEDRKCMVFHTGPQYEERHYYLHLYIKIDNEYAMVGTYQQEKDRNFFIIDDVFFSAPLYYDVTGYDEDPRYQWDDDEEGVPLMTSPDLTTGMCELKQKK